LVGALAAYHPDLRVPVLLAAIVEEIAFVLGVLLLPLPLGAAAYLAAGFDATSAALYVLHLAGL
jgi:hypothetical protein